MEKIIIQAGNIPEGFEFAPGEIVELPVGKAGEVSDGYHTFDELYDHRITLFIALCRAMQDMAYYMNAPLPERIRNCGVWRSKTHHDSSVWEGWFIMGIGKEKGTQISYHLPMSRWDETYFAETLERAPEWDGHTSSDVLERLKWL